ncbi:MAG TPA: DUF4340 domain-containing protein [Candidatus Acidoferrum sp.]|nr:DUF4340 domain-containing protein [Candidatus Acidoferrum sp.]
MKPKGLLMALVLLAGFGGAAVWVYKHPASDDGKKTADGSNTKLLTIADDQFQGIKIAKLTGETVELKKQNGKWLMTAPRQLTADQDAAGSMQSTLGSLTSDKLIEPNATDLKGFGLDQPTLDVSVARKDGKTDRLLIGDDTPTGAGSYAKLAGDPRVFTVSSTVKSTLDKRPDDLRDKRLLTFDGDKSSRVELAGKGAPVEFGKNGQNEWTIVKPRPLRADGGAVDGLVSKLKDAKMDVTSTPEEAAKKFAGGAKVAVVTVTDAGGTQTLEVRRDQEKNVYARSSVVDGVYKANIDLGDAVDKGVDDFRNKKVFDFGFSDPNKVDLKGASYTKEGDKWKSGAKVMDNTTVQNLIDKLRDLSATKFAEKGAGAPIFEATVTSNGGKRAEKVTITRQGDQSFAQREGEPSIYVLDSKAVEDLQKAAGDVKEASPEQPKKK